jgi:hypothetical protein
VMERCKRGKSRFSRQIRRFCGSYRRSGFFYSSVRRQHAQRAREKCACIMWLFLGENAALCHRSPAFVFLAQKKCEKPRENRGVSKITFDRAAQVRVKMCKNLKKSRGLRRAIWAGRRQKTVRDGVRLRSLTLPTRQVPPPTAGRASSRRTRAVPVPSPGRRQPG